MEAAASAALGVADSVQAAASAPLDWAGSEEKHIVLSGTTTEKQVIDFIKSKAVRGDKSSSLYAWLVGLNPEKDELNIQKKPAHRKVTPQLIFHAPVY